MSEASTSSKEKKAEEKKKVTTEKKKDEEPVEVVAPVSLASSLLFVLKVVVLSLAVIGLVIWYVGWKQLALADVSPSALPPLIAVHMGKGSFVPIHDGERGLNLFVSTAGIVNGSEETVLFLHRIPGSSLSFSDAQAALAEQGIASIGIDLPGFGLSDKPAGAAYTLDYLARGTADALTSMHVDKVSRCVFFVVYFLFSQKQVHLVGVGESCFVGARLAELFPHLVSSVVLLDCEVPPTRPPSLVAFVFEHSPALPSFAHALLFGGSRGASSAPDSAVVAAANRWLTVYKGGQASFFSFCGAAGGARLVGEAPLRGLCGLNNCVLGDIAQMEGLAGLEPGLALGPALARFVRELPPQARQNKQARAPPKVQYVQPSGDKYGAGAGHGHHHGGHDEGHVHGAQCNH